MLKLHSDKMSWRTTCESKYPTLAKWLSVCLRPKSLKLRTHLS